MPLSTEVGLSGLAIVLVGVAVVLICGIKMIVEINKDPGPEGHIPIISIFLKTIYTYHPLQRYRAKNGKSLLYRVLQVGWLLVAVGLLGAFGSDHIGHAIGN